MRLPTIALAVLLAGCAATRSAAPPASQAAPPVPRVTDLAPYFVTLNQIAAAEPARQAMMMEELRAGLLSNPGARSALRHALAVGAAGREGSDPVEARQLLAGLLASPGDLEPAELQMAAALQREFDARVTLYAQLARQREQLDARLAAANETNARALQAASAETSRLRRELQQAETKLQAITEMERDLLEQTEPAPPQPP